MTLTKEQLINNLIKYNAISAKEAKRFNLSKRATIVGFMNAHLPDNIIKDIYEYEYCTDNDKKDYTPIKGFNPYSEKQSNEERVEMVYSQAQKGFIAKEDKSIFDNSKQEPETKQEEILRGRPTKNRITVGDLLFQGKLKNIKTDNRKEMTKNVINDDKIQKILDKIEENY